MLSELLASYARMKIPEGTSVEFVIVENNDEATLASVIKDFQGKLCDHTVYYRIEPRLGIPFARNHVLQFAIDNGFDYLTFADDDEVVEPSWLVKLLAERDRGDYDIVGSPVRIAPISGDYPAWNHVVWAGLNRINLDTECKFIRGRRKGRAHLIRIATGSWMGSLHFFRRTGLRFDPRFGLAGGEDWRLWEEARKIGAKTGWTPYAVAYEAISRSRLQLRYCYMRDRDHARMVAHARMLEQPARAIRRLPGSVLSRTYKLLIATASIPVTRGHGLVTMAILAGRVVGLVQGTFGMTSHHYRYTSGD